MNILKRYLKNYWWKLIIIVAVLAIDLLTKFLIVPSNRDLWQETTLIEGVLQIVPTWNDGAGFSTFSGKRALLIAISTLFLIAIVCYDIFFKKKSKLFGTATALIVGVALGNLFDRIFNVGGYVRDFIYLQFINFPVFNVADMCLTVGVILLLIYFIKDYVQSQKQSQKDDKQNCLQNSNEDGTNKDDTTKKQIDNTSQK